MRILITVLCFCGITVLSAAEGISLDEWECVIDEKKVVGSTSRSVKAGEFLLNISITSDYYPIHMYKVGEFKEIIDGSGGDMRPDKKATSYSLGSNGRQVSFKVKAPSKRKLSIKSLQGTMDVTLYGQTHEAELSVSKELYGKTVEVEGLPGFKISFIQDQRGKCKYEVNAPDEMKLLTYEVHNYHINKVYARQASISSNIGILFDQKIDKPYKSKFVMADSVQKMLIPFSGENLPAVVGRSKKPCNVLEIPLIFRPKSKKMQRELKKKMKKRASVKTEFKEVKFTADNVKDLFPLIEDVHVYLANSENLNTPKTTFGVFENIALVCKSTVAKKDWWCPYCINSHSMVDGELIDSWAVRPGILMNQRAATSKNGRDRGQIDLKQGVYKLLNRAPGEHSFIPVFSTNDKRYQSHKAVHAPAISYTIVVEDKNKDVYNYLIENNAFKFFSDFYCARRKGEFETEIKYYDVLKAAIEKYPDSDVFEAIQHRFIFMMRQLTKKSPNEMHWYSRELLPFVESDVNQLVEVLKTGDPKIVIKFLDWQAISSPVARSRKEKDAEDLYFLKILKQLRNK